MVLALVFLLSSAILVLICCEFPNSWMSISRLLGAELIWLLTSDAPVISLGFMFPGDLILASGLVGFTITEQVWWFRFSRIY